MSMFNRTTVGRIAGLLVAACVGVSCNEGVAPTAPGMPHFAAAAGSGILLDQAEGALNTGTGWPNGGTHVGKSFDANPHLGDAIVVTFYWQGSTNTITTVTDHLEDGTAVGNIYTLVDYSTAGGYSMATYVATNIQNFPDPAASSGQLLAVHAIFSVPVAEGGIMISAYSGVATTTATALGAFHSATGTASTTAVSDPGAISAGANALVYGVTMADAVVNTNPPSAFSQITAMWDTTIKTDGVYTVQAAAGSVDPQWTWSFSAPTTWFATVLALNPATSTTNQPPTAAFTSSCSTLTCNFTSTSSDPDGTIASYAWTFGDGGTSTAQNPSYTYGAAGTYTVTLTVTDNQGATNAVSHSVTVTPPNQTPVVSAGSNETVVVGLLYTLNASFSDPDNGPWTYTINWGDGSTSSGSRSSQGAFSAGHTYVAPLTQHTVTVTVTDSLGASGSASKTVSVIL